MARQEGSRHSAFKCVFSESVEISQNLQEQHLELCSTASNGRQSIGQCAYYLLVRFQAS